MQPRLHIGARELFTKRFVAARVRGLLEHLSGGAPSGLLSANTYAYGRDLRNAL